MGLSIVGGGGGASTVDRTETERDTTRVDAAPDAAVATGTDEERVVETDDDRDPAPQTAAAERRQEITAGADRLRADLERRMEDERARVLEEEAARVVDDERAREIEAAVRTDHFDPGLAAVEMLAGRSELGPLTGAEPEHLIETTVDAWAEGDPITMARNLQMVRTGLDVVPEAEEAGRGIAEPLAERAVAAVEEGTLRGMSDGVSFAMTGVRAAADAEGRRDLIEGLGEDAAGLVASLQLDDDRSFGVHGPSQYERTLAAGDLLEAAALGEPTAASAEVTQAIFERLPAEAYEWSDDLASQMGAALGQHWHPDDPAAAAAEGERFASILETPQGRDLLASPDVPASERARALAVLRADPSLDGAALAAHDGDGWTHPEITRRLAEPRAEAFLAGRGDAEAPLEGAALSNTVGIAMGLPPHVDEDEADAARVDREAALDLGSHDYFAEGPHAEAVGTVAESIRAIGGATPEVAVLPIQYSSDALGTVELPLFRVRDAETGDDRFVDNVGRQYDSFEAWRTENVLPGGNVVFPEDGHLTRGEDGRVALVSEATHATIDTVGERALAVADGAVLVGGVVAGGLVIAGSGGTAAPLVFAGASAYGAVRSGGRLVDRHTHGQTLDPLRDADARSAWLELGANALGFAGAGVSMTASAVARSGSGFAPAFRNAAGVVNVAATGADAAAVTDAAHTLSTRWDELSPGQRAELGLSIAFWGGSIPARRTLAPEAPPPPAARLRDGAHWTDADYASAFLEQATPGVRRELGALTPAQLRALVPEGGAYPTGLDVVGGVEGFGQFAIDRPADARRLIDAGTIYGSQVADGIRRDGFQSAHAYWNYVTPSVHPHPDDPNFVVREPGHGTPGWLPDLEVIADGTIDHNGAFRANARLGPGWGNARSPAPARIVAEQLVVDGQPYTSLDGVAVFGAHGGGTRFGGASNQHAADLMAASIADAAAAGRPIHTVVLDACNQRNLGFDLRANGQRFEARLNDALRERGLPEVRVLAAEATGPTWGNQQRPWYGGAFFDATYGPTPGARLDPRDVLPYAGALAVGAGGGAGAMVIYRAVSEDDER